jgi:lipoprotein NlpD
MLNNHIRITARDHAPVVAAATGTVIFSAPLRDFGETIIIKHDQQFATVYTNLGSRAVKADSRVKKSEVIGMTGKSEKRGEGYIDFEIRQNNKARNPLSFLP